MSSPSRGEVWTISTSPSTNFKAVVMSDPSVQSLPLRIVVPFKDWHGLDCPWAVTVKPSKANGLTCEMVADALSIRSLSPTTFVKKIGLLTEREVANIAAAIVLCVGFEL